MDDSVREDGLRYISFIINITEPLSLPDLRLLLGIDIHSRLIAFSGLISIPSSSSPEPVQIAQTSFREFVQNRVRASGYVNTSAIHAPLAVRCFRTMATLLKRDICGRHDAPSLYDFSQKRDAIPRALKYASHHWLYHLQHARRDDELHSCLLDFLEKRLLYAIEMYAILGKLHTATGLFRAARETVKNWTDGSFPRKTDALALLYDAWRFIMCFYDPISVSPLEVYNSALPCCPTTSLLRFTYRHMLEELSWNRIEEGLDAQWDPVIRVIDMKTEDFELAPSPDGSQVATLSRNSDSSEIKLWDTATGTLITSQRLEGIRGSGIVNGGPFLAYRDNQNCYLWRLHQPPVVPISAPPNEEFFGPVAISHDRTRIVLFSVSRAAAGKGIVARIYCVSTLEPLAHCSLPLRTVETPLEVAVDFSSRDDCMLVQASSSVLKSSINPSAFFLFDPSDGHLLWQGEQESSWAIFSHTDDILTVAAAPSSNKRSWKLSLMTRVMSLQDTLAAASPSGTRSKSLMGPPGSHRRRLRDLLRSPKKPFASASSDENFLKVVPPSTSPIYPHAIEFSDQLVAIKQGDHIATVHDQKRSAWRSSIGECFGIARKSRQFWIVDLAQIILQPDGKSQLSTSEVPADYQLVCISGNADLKAYKSTTATERYLVYRFEDATTAYSILREITPETPGTTSNPYSASTACCAFSPHSTYFATATGYKRQIEVWSVSSGHPIGHAPISMKLHVSTSTIKFSSDDKLVALAAQESALIWRIFVFSLKDGGVKNEGSTIVAPETSGTEGSRGSRESDCRIVSVTIDAVDFLSADGNCRFIRHLRWELGTSNILTISLIPNLGSIRRLAYSPSFKRIHLRDRSTEYALNMTTASPSEAGGAGQTYEVEEGKNPDVYYDSFSWSDLCLCNDGWLQQRYHKICWLPVQYRPLELEEKGLQLIVAGDKVTILHLRDGKRVTIRVPNLSTDIRYFE
ncbi:hypothetical protein CONPUDRAFT_77645 [Coniophora puteana RWD-64-598 SS2]|uniref:WD40 repeat-like protein n=1 Tax=Coniophora puteana (strain RWD-64-598) TaxID=741705 RepID=A0A5M3M7I2_CONPW|nr:uncharacterized protein CONPUDRAFT_77645 [Coniophora puteana RWD-64-598 SS2]EIW74814.1 hypothetical protein CONPUDRAFT_77645 [Coniophora puteana RWD-64-598 SS2]